MREERVSEESTMPTENADLTKVDWIRIWPFIFLHLACLGVIFTGWSYFAIAFALAMYLVRMFSITAFYHRYFSHKAFKTSRVVQFIFALIGSCSTQRGPLWWAAHHRQHHRESDTQSDPHTPKKGFVWSHMVWFLSRENLGTDESKIPDLMKYPELRWLDKHDILVPFLFATLIFVLGKGLEIFFPSLGVTGWQLLVWGYFISTVVLIHCTLTINSLAHTYGKRRYKTSDDSRNNVFLAILTLGEGWHNNHHYFPASARQGFFWWEIDVSYYILRMMSWFGLVWDLKPVPDHKKYAFREERV